MIKILFVSGPNAGNELLIQSDFFSIGRELDNQLCIDDAKSSRYHLCISQRHEGYELIDNQSTNGTFVNGARLTAAHLLREEDELQFGSSVCRVVSIESEEKTLLLTDGRFIIQSPEGSFETVGGFITIGRGAENHLFIDEPKASREHAHLIYRESAFFLRDNQSTNGTYLKEKRIVEEPLSDGDIAFIGGYRLVFQLLAQDALKIEVRPPTTEEKFGIEAANLLAEEKEVSPSAVPTIDHVPEDLVLSRYVRLPTLLIDTTPPAVLEATAPKNKVPVWVATSDVLNDGRRRLYIGGSVAATLVLTMAMFLTGFTRPFMNRPLSKYHQSEKFYSLVKEKNLGSECAACHTSFEGVSTQSCKTCHEAKPSIFGKEHNGNATFNAAANSHGDSGDCLGCHVEHEGIDAEQTKASDPTKPALVEKKCWGCHAAPSGAKERGYHKKETLRFTQLASADTGRDLSAPLLDVEHFRKSVVSTWPDSIHSTHGEVPGYCGSCHASPTALPSPAPSERGDQRLALVGEAESRCFNCHAINNEASCIGCHDQHEDNLIESSESKAQTSIPGGVAGAVMALLLFSPALFIFLRKKQKGQLLPVDPTKKKKRPRDPNKPEPAAKKVTVIIKKDICIGCSACINSCPYDVLELDELAHKSKVVRPDQCIGDMRCTKACPVGACIVIEGDKIPEVEQVEINAFHESNISGLYVIGEGCGKPLIKNAINHGKIAMDHISSQLSSVSPVLAAGQAAGSSNHKQALDTGLRRYDGSDDIYDVLIVGSGPAGLSAALSAKEYGLRYLLLEKAPESTDTIRNFPKAKIVLAEPVSIPLAGKLWMEDTNKETLIAKWEEIIHRTKLEVTLNQEVTGVTKADDLFIVQTNKASYKAKKVVLAPGTRGAPNKIRCPGEASLHPRDKQPRVMYRLTDPEPYKKKSCMVIGGGDSAVEAARTLADNGANVTLVYRNKSFAKIKERNLELTLEYVKKKKITLYLLGNCKEVLLDEKGRPAVKLQHEAGASSVQDGEFAMNGKAGELLLQNDYIFALLGAAAPSAFFRSCGITIKKIQLS